MRWITSRSGCAARRTRERGVNPLVLWLVRAILQPFFHIYLRMERIGREHIPAEGPVILASNHRSFFDPFVIGTMVRRPVYYVAKQELFEYHPDPDLAAERARRVPGRPGRRRPGDDRDRQGASSRAASIVLMFPEGTRTRPGSLGKPKRGVGRLALETGAPVVPIAIIGTEDIRKGWRIRPRKVRLRAGRPLTFPKVEDASPALAGAVTDRIWPCVMLQWEWLGGLPPIRRAAIIGAGTVGHEPGRGAGPRRASRSTSAAARTSRPPRSREQPRNERYLPGVELPDSIHVMRAAELELVDRRPGLPGRAGEGAARGARRPRRTDRAALRRAGAGQGPGAAARHAAVGVRAQSAARPRRCRPGRPGVRGPTCSSTAPRSCSPRSTARSRASWPTRCATADWT